MGGLGMCENGCGRPVYQKRPSDTLSERPQGRCCPIWCKRLVDKGAAETDRSYNTCCRSCAQGYHDPWCCSDTPGPLTPSALCRMGCGRTVAASRHGEQFDTCCKGCALRKGHTKECHQREKARGDASEV